MDNILNTILKETYTLQQFIRRVRLLKDYVNTSLFKGVNAQIDLNNLTSNSNDLNWLRSLPENGFFNQFNNQSFNQIFDYLDQTIQNQKPLLIYIPFEMPDDEIAKMGGSLRTSYGGKFLFDLKYDPSLLAGCSLVWNGLHKDYSIKKKIEGNETEIIKEINSYIKH